MIQDRFRGKVWIYWAQLIICALLGTFALIFGVVFWTGAMTDANGVARPQAGPPMVITGACLMIVGTLSLFNIIGRFTPLIRCYREGIEFNLVGATSLDGVPMVPKFYRVAWAILSLQGFRSQRTRLMWQSFRSAEVRGVPMAYLLRINGTSRNQKTGRESDGITFKQVALRDTPQQIAQVLSVLARDPAQREQLASWDS